MWYNRLGFKLILFVGSILVIALGIFTYVSINSQKRQLIGEVLKGASRISETIKRSTRYDMLKHEIEAVHNIIETIGEQEGIDKIRIFNKEGKITFSTDKKDIGSMVDNKAEACYTCHSAEKPLEKLPTPERNWIYRTKEGPRVLRIINLIYNEKDCYAADCHVHPSSQKILGVLDIGIYLADVDHQIERNQKKTLAFAIVLFLGISVTIGMFVQRSVSRPVRALVDETKRIASGDLGSTLKIESRDEIGVLAKAFNQMTIDLENSREQLIQQEKMASIGQLAAGVAHELNNPLGGILGYSQFALEKITKKTLKDLSEDDICAYAQYLRDIEYQSQRCKTIVQNLLKFARSSTRVAFEPLDLNSVLNETLVFLRHQTEMNRVKLIKDFRDSLSRVMGNANQLQQVFTNIILNAIQAMPDGGQLIISTKEIPEAENLSKRIEITFEDTGCGIPENQLNKIFEHFFTTKKEGEGTGLGLAVSYGIIKNHKGEILVQSEVGKGTKFIIWIPVVLKQETFEDNKKVEVLKNA